ncbi:hypothetical protein [Nostoc sp.]|uniref:hypothetical protein n=1 Tax=Nostoc sp. TaxID=1180 RepID=UPI002FF649AD
MIAHQPMSFSFTGSLKILVLLASLSLIACAILVWLRLKDLAYKTGQTISGLTQKGSESPDFP